MIYFILDDEAFIKIGSSLSPHDRLREFQGHNPHNLVLLGCVRGSLKEERAFQLRFDKHRHRHEWFHATAELRAEIAAILKEHGVAVEPPGKSTLPEWQARKLAVKADCDPRIIKKVAAGYSGTSLAASRAREALVEAGILAA